MPCHFLSLILSKHANVIFYIIDISTSTKDFILNLLLLLPLYNLGVSIYKYSNIQEMKKLCTSSEYVSATKFCREIRKYLRLSVIHESQELSLTCE